MLAPEEYMLEVGLCESARRREVENDSEAEPAAAPADWPPLTAA